jgi:glycosyltransferase Alg8
MFFVSGWAVIYYLIWVMISRYLVVLSFFLVRPQVSIWYVPLLYFNQIFGSIIKVMVFFRLDRQRWTRQNTTLKNSGNAAAERFKLYSSHYVTAMSVAIYLAALLLFAGLHTPPLKSPAPPVALEGLA